MNDDILDDGIVFQKEASIENAKEILRLKGEYADLHPKVKHGRTAIWWMTGLFFLGMLVEGYQFNFEAIVMGINFAIVILMAGTGYLSYRKPFLGFLLGLCVIAGIQVLIVVGGGGIDAIRGILPRLIIMYFIFNGLMAANDYVSTVRGLKAHGINVEGSDLV